MLGRTLGLIVRWAHEGWVRPTGPGYRCASVGASNIDQEVIQVRSRVFSYFHHNVLGLVAIFIALGGSAYALGSLPKNSVGTKQLKNGAVTGKKVAKNTLTGANINASTLGTVPDASNAASSDRLGGLGANAFQLRVTGTCASGAINQVNQNGSVGCAAAGGPPSGQAGGALSGNYPNPSLNVSGGDSGSSACQNGEAITALTGLAALTCSPGVYNDVNGDVAAGPSPFGALTVGGGNVAVGQSMLTHDSTGSDNTAAGDGALNGDTTGGQNAAFGGAALQVNSTASDNTAIGDLALSSANTGGDNTASGYEALARVTTGTANAALGSFAGESLTTGSNNIDINNHGTTSDANAIKIGVQGTQTSTLIAGINGASISGPTNLAVTNSSGLIGTGTTGSVALPSAVDGATSSSGVDLLINSSGVLGTTTSSRRFKTDIRSITPTLERKLMELRPVTFHYKRRYIQGQPDPLEYGLIAEGVAKVIPNLVAYGLDGKPYTVRYQELPVLLLAELQRQQAQITRQQAEINWLMGQMRGHKG
jgi:hypothetical protein